MNLKFAYKIAPEHHQPDKLLDNAILAEKYGFESFWISDHFHPWGHIGGGGAFAWTWISSAAERTHTATIGTDVTAPILRYHPGIVAQAFATLGYMYPERIFLGLGAGEALNESPLGYVWPSPRERVEMLEEAIIVIKRLWTEDFVDFNGKYYRLKKANLYTKPQRPLKIYVAAGGPRTAELAGRPPVPPSYAFDTTDPAPSTPAPSSSNQQLHPGDRFVFDGNGEMPQPSFVQRAIAALRRHPYRTAFGIGGVAASAWGAYRYMKRK